MEESPRRIDPGLGHEGPDPCLYVAVGDSEDGR